MTIMRISRRLFTQGLAASGVLAVTPSPSLAGTTIRLAVADRAAPIAYRRDDGVVSGIVVDLVRAVGRVAGWQIDPIAFPWSRAQALVRDDKADALCSLATDERRQFLVFAPLPLFSLNAGFFHFSADNPRRAELRRIASIDDLRQFRIVAALGDSWPNELFAGWPNFQEVPDIGTAMKLVSTLRADLVFDAREVTNFFQKQSGLPPLEVADGSFLPGSLSLYRFGLRRNLDRVDTLIADFAQAQDKAQSSGALASVLRSYLS